EYDIPQEVVAEGIVNAVAHRDYTSNASVEVQLFPDRLEIWNPGTIHHPLTLENLLLPHASQHNNPLIAEPLFLTKYIEKAGSGTVDMLKRCLKAGLRQPEFLIDSGFFVLTIWRKVVPDSVVQVEKSQLESVSGVDKIGTMSALSRHQVEILHKCLTDNGITELMEIAGRTDRTKFRNQVLNPLIEARLLEMTVPDKPRSSKQKYRATEKGQNLLTKQRNGAEDNE
ncbi:MAG: ATP-binding protein, partial [Candidatus Methanoperedens sp.]|nr:ATP-binding protein [Candidatus Methanoperedens sp.]